MLKINLCNSVYVAWQYWVLIEGFTKPLMRITHGVKERDTDNSVH